MIESIGSNGNTINWYSLLNTQRKHAAGAAQSASSGSDTAEIGLQGLGSSSGERKNPLEQLVNDGTITAEQAEAIDGALRSAIQSGAKPGDGNDPLAGLVEDGTITRDQADGVKSALDAMRPERGRTDFMSGVLDTLVSGGTLTEDQAESVKSALMQGPQGAPPPQGAPAAAGESSGEADESIDLSGLSEDEILQLLSSGRITAQQAAEALQKLEGKGDSGTEGNTASGITQGSYQGDPLDGLVASGVLTQDQEDAVKSAFKLAMDMNRAVKAYAVE